MLQARQAGFPLPSGAVLISPGIKALHDEDPHLTKSDSSLSPDGIAAFRQAFQAHQHSQHPLSLLLSGNLSGLSPLLFQVGSEELLMEEVIALSERAKAAGVETTLEIYEAMPHVFQVNGSLPESKRALESIADFIKGCLRK
jgi:acetyl esterase/lipase